MLNSHILEVAIGVVFAFASVALMASTAKEAIASLAALRAKTLFSGIKQILNDPNFEGLALQVYNHATVNPRGDGKIVPNTAFKHVVGAPAYMDSHNFAVAIVDALSGTSRSVEAVRTAISQIPDAQIRQLLLGMLVRAGADIDDFEKRIATWFDTSMDRLSGLYKRYAQVICFVCGLAIAALLNVDAVHLVRELWQDPASLSQAFPKSVSESEAYTRLMTLPIGEPFLDKCPIERFWDVVGVLITASAAMFGAPFWFDMLQRLVQLRSTGPKPDKAPTT